MLHAILLLAMHMYHRMHTLILNSTSTCTCKYMYYWISWYTSYVRTI